jgi:undecaprenyl-diphosphatase
VYIAAHYPWDVAAGLALGAIVAVAGWLLLRRPLIALVAWLRLRPGVRAMFDDRTAGAAYGGVPSGAAQEHLATGEGATRA